MIKNAFYKEIEEAYARHASVDELKILLGRALKGMFEGDLEQGELEIGQDARLKKYYRLLIFWKSSGTNTSPQKILSSSCDHISPNVMFNYFDFEGDLWNHSDNPSPSM